MVTDPFTLCCIREMMKLFLYMKLYKDCDSNFMFGTTAFQAQPLSDLFFPSSHAHFLTPSLLKLVVPS